MSSEVYYRSWMDKPHLDPNTNLLTEEYVQGIGEFMRLVQQQPDAKSVKHSSSISPKEQVGPDAPTDRRVGSISLPSSRPRSSPLRHQIEPALVSSRSESSLELYDLKTARTRSLE
ncbi:hypothetical protein DY000_02004577 [Brassica cretica]|uniref:Uncharacterized protein n=1 Tax=Brassica cretica TaxID=69181 RepID=A0ABQ7CAH1_BRACR|nr:hypothetical protein DY000_02004577 [Brassica cretica]